MTFFKQATFVAVAALMSTNAVFAEGFDKTHGDEINIYLNHDKLMPVTDEKVSQFLAAFSNTPNPEMSLQAMETKGLQKGSLRNKPWSSNAWNDYYGSVSRPYSDPKFTDSMLFASQNWSYIQKRQDEVQKNVLTLSQAELLALSPAQKYDLMMGDVNFTFSRKVLDWVMQREEQHLLAFWSGICHGWSPSTGAYPRPKNWFTVKSPLGMNITFYPDDVKALEAFAFATMNYANGENVSIGKQCRKFVTHDSRESTTLHWAGKTSTDSNDRLKSPECFDVNPGLFHLATVNSINLGQHTFVMDRKNDKSVYNQPVFAYQYSYYNVYTRKKVKTLMEAYANLRTGLYKDPYKQYRSPRAFAAVGVEMTVWFADETKPKARSVDSEKNDKIESVTTHYDLEIDESGTIVGGEWHHYTSPHNEFMDLFEYFTYSHPDTLWTAKAGTKPESVAACDDKSQFGKVNPSEFMTDKWLQCSRYAALNFHIQENSDHLVLPDNTLVPIKDCVTEVRMHDINRGKTRADLTAIHDECALRYGVKRENLKWLIVDEKPQPLGAVVEYLANRAAGN